MAEPPASTRPRRVRGTIPGAGAITLGLVVLAGLGWAVAVGIGERGSPDDDRVADATVARPDERAIDRSDDPRDAPAPTTATPLCTAAPGCFAWIVELDAGADLGAVATDDLVLTYAARHLHAYRLEDGSLAWSALLDPPEATRAAASGLRHTSWVRAADDLVLHLDGAELVARDATDGSLRWWTAEVEVSELEGAAIVDGRLLVSGPTRDDPVDRRSVVGIDPGNGEVVWRWNGVIGAAVADDAAYLVDAERRAVRVDPGGEIVWRTAALDSSGGVWLRPAGPVVAIVGPAGSDLFGREDGAAIAEHGGQPITHDDDAAALVKVDEQDDDATLQLVTAEEVAWEVPLLDDVSRDGCWWERVSLTDREVEVELCGGGRVTYDRRDGRELARTEPRRDEVWRPSVGPYTLTTSGRLRSETVVHDRATGAEVARLPGRVLPIYRFDGDRASTDLGGIVVLQGRGWLVALRLPDDTP